MFCTQCGSDVPVAATACPVCGTRLAAERLARPAGARAGRADQPTVPVLQFDLHRWTSGDRVTGTGTAVLFVSLFLPWYGVSFLGVSAQADGLTGHGYLYLVLLLSLAILAYLVVRAVAPEGPARLPFSHEQRLFAAAGLNAVLVLLAFLVKPDGTGWRFGAFVGLAAALAAIAPLVVPSLRARRARG